MSSLKLPINVRENCKRMLMTGVHQTEHHKAEEERWLIKYLSKQKYDPDVIYNKWLEFYVQRNDRNSLDDSSRQLFDVLMSPKRLNTIKIDKKYNDLIIYKDEFDVVNNFKLKRWERQYLLAIIGYLRVTGVYTLDSFPFKEVIYMTSYGHKSSTEIEYYQKTLDLLMRVGFIERKERIETYKEVPIIDDEGFLCGYTDSEDELIVEYDFKDISDHKEIYFKSNTYADIKYVIDAVPNIETCSICGKEFTVNNKTQRNICDECQKKSLAERRKERRKRNALSKEEK